MCVFVCVCVFHAYTQLIRIHILIWFAQIHALIIINNKTNCAQSTYTHQCDSIHNGTEHREHRTLNTYHIEHRTGRLNTNERNYSYTSAAQCQGVAAKTDQNKFICIKKKSFQHTCMFVYILTQCDKTE